MTRIISRFAIAAALLGSATVAMAAPRNATEDGFRAVYEQNHRAFQQDEHRTTGYTGPGAGSINQGQFDRTAATED